MAIEEVAVGGVDPLLEPQPRVGEAGRGGCGARGERRGGVLGVGELLEPKRLGVVQEAALEPGLDQVMVVVAGDEDDLPAGADRPPDRLEGRRRELDHPPQRAVAELEDVAEQDDAIVGGEERCEPLEERRPAQKVGVGGGPEVKVRDDDGSHGIHPRIAAGSGVYGFRRRIDASGWRAR